MRLWHGTSAVHRKAILAHGLRPSAGVAVFVTGDEERAAGYAARAVCVELHRRGVHALKLAKPALVLGLDVHEDHVEIDPSHRGDFAMIDGCPAECIVSLCEFDARRWLRPGDVARYGELAALARSVEGLRAVADVR
jgi:hypothetical protein